MRVSIIFFVILVTLLLSETNAQDGFSESRIVGGINANPNQFPYQVSLQSNGRHFCGGSIIKHSWIVTAGHCVKNTPVTVVAGEHDFNVKSGFEQTRTVAQWIVHPDYKGGVGPNDIALVKLSTSFVFNERVGAIRLPIKNTYPMDQGMVSGWGSTNGVGSIYPNILQRALLPIHTQANCFSYWVGSPFTNLNICAGPLDGSKSVCFGDSGGPLVTGSGIQSVLVGIVSWGRIPCGTPNKPGVFVQVSKYTTWIFVRSTYG